MIKIKILTGSYAGQERVVPDSIDPQELLMQLAGQGWRWEIEWPAANDREAAIWARADMASKIISALFYGRFVHFMGFEWRVPAGADRNEAHRIVGEVEDAISNSGANVFVESDTDEGVTIGVDSSSRPLM